MERPGTGPQRRPTPLVRAAASAMLTAAILLALLVQAAPAPAKPKPKKPKHGADLIITKLAVDAGTPTYLIADPDGSLSDFDVMVTVKNAGDRTAGKSHLKIWIDHGIGSITSHIGVGYAVIPRLAPGRKHTVTLNAGGLKVHGPLALAPISVVAKANFSLVLPELHYTNNTRYSPDIPVIARVWKATTWSVHSVSSVFGPYGSMTLDSTGQAASGFVWRYSHFDGADQFFVYDAHGTLDQTTSVTSSNCNGSGSGSTSHSGWPLPSTNFSIDFTQTHYLGTVDAKSEPHYTVPIQCSGHPASVSPAFLDLLTYLGPGPARLPVAARQLSGTGTLRHGLETLTYSWRFDADLP